MRKKFTIFLILIFVLGFTPVNFSNAITQNQIDAEVQIVCTDGADSWFSGSGTIIDPKGIILTNRHVIEGAYKNTCFIGFIESISQEPNFGTEGNYNLAEVKYYTTTDDMDAAILYLDNPTNKIYPYINIWDSNSDSLQFGNKVEAIGFPSIGGSTITYTSGDFSGFGSKSDGTQNYIKSTAQLEHGNSGGALYNSSGQFIGIPTMVVAGTLNSLSYILSVNSIKKWLSGILGSGYQNEVIKQSPAPTKPTVSIQNDITPPYLKEFGVHLYGYDDDGKMLNFSYRYGNSISAVYEYKNIKLAWSENCESSACVNDNSGNIKGYYYYFGKNINATPKFDGKYISTEDIIKTKDPFGYNEVQLPEVFNPEEGEDYYFILQAEDYSDNISNPFMYFRYVYDTRKDSAHNLESIDIYNNQNNIIARVQYLDLKQYLLYDLKEEIDTNQKKLIIYPNYNYNTNGLIYYISYGTDYCFGSPFNESREGIQTDDNYIEIDNVDIHKSVNLFIKPSKNLSKYFESWTSDNFAIRINYKSTLSSKIAISSNKKNRWCGGWDRTYKSDNITVKLFDVSLSKKLSGKILLQVESHGEAFYVNPKDGRGYYMANGNEAYRIMRYLGVGITNNDLEKVKTNKYFAKQHSGKIFLQVEEHGEAYYIDFEGEEHYLRDGSAAYNIMRDLGLGITNDDLNKIPEGNL
ncbi:MAG: S1C family serine protease [Patescibacteria group bacterium]